MQTRRKIVRLPPSFYVQQRKELADQGRTPPRPADRTMKSLASVIVKVKKHCLELGKRPDTFLKEAESPDLKVFLLWVLNNYKRIRAASSLKNYWRVLRMHILDKTGRVFSESDKRDIRNYTKHLEVQFRLRTLPMKKPVADCDDLYLWLYTHWVIDDSVFPDERQRVQHSAGMLMGGFFGCRLCSIFDTRVKLDLPNIDDLSLSDTTTTGDHDTNSNGEDDTWMVVDSDCGVDSKPTRLHDHDGEGYSESNTAYNSDSDNDSNTAYDGDSDSDSDLSLGNNIAEDCDTDDECTAGSEETRSFLYRHFTIYIVPSSTPGKPNTIFTKITLLHTKGEDNHPRIKTLVIDGENDHPLFCLLDHLLSLALIDKAFEAESAHDIKNIFWVKMPPGKQCLTLKWKREVLDLPVLREPMRGSEGSGTSPTKPLRADTFARNLKRTGRKAGLEGNLGQKYLRRGLLNVVNRKAPASVRDQLFDHKLGAAGYYLNQDVEVNTKACFLQRPSNEMVQKMARLASLTADPNAPMELSEEQKAEFRRHPNVIRLSNSNKALTAKLKLRGYKPISTAKGTPLYEQKMKVQSRLNSYKVRLRQSMIEKGRKRHFREADTIAFNSQFSASSDPKNLITNEPAARRKYNIPERAGVVRWICQPAADLTDEEILTRRIRGIEALAALCRRQETQRRGRPKRSVEQEESETSSDDMEENVVDPFPMECKPKQCIFCLGDDRKLYEERLFEYSKVNKMLNEVGKHLKTFAPDDKVPCPHPQCKAAKRVLPNVMTFKNHTAKVHKISLRA